jgi:putative oxidoreductase
MVSDTSKWTGYPRDAVLLAARLLLAFIFIHEGVFLLANFDSAASSVAKLGVPRPALVGTVAVQLIAGLAIAFGILTRVSAVALGLFCLSTAMLFHTQFAIRNELLHFEKDLAIAGGLFLLAVQGGGSWSIETLRARDITWAPHKL